MIFGLAGLPQLSRHSMLRDGERCLGSHEVVAGVMAMSAHLTQDAGRAHTGGEQADRNLNMDTQEAALTTQNIQEKHVIG